MLENLSKRAKVYVKTLVAVAPYSPVRLIWSKVNQEELEQSEILALLKLVSFDDR